MKKDLHPTYETTTITCACGNILEVGSTKKDLKVDVCSKCHPYWTGNLKQNTKWFNKKLKLYIINKKIKIFIMNVV